jgi:flagellar biosynthesis/type III secretory pathway chaperone
MEHNAEVQDLLNSLENVLVQEFRTLQSLILATKEERTLLNDKNPDAILAIVEEKEGLLDQFGLLEEKRRMFVTSIANELGIKLTNISIYELFSGLDSTESDRLLRLNDGIKMLVQQSRDLNYGNQALARTALDWLISAQTFLLNITNPAEEYYPPGIKPSLDHTYKSQMGMKA